MSLDRNARKDNLVFKIQQLEGQKERLTEKAKARHPEAEELPEEVSTQIAEIDTSIHTLRKQLVERKVHHGVGLIERALKKEKPTVRSKMSKGLNSAKKIAEKMPNEKAASKVEQLTKELEDFQQLNHETIAKQRTVRLVEQQVLKQLTEEERKQYSELLPEWIVEAVNDRENTLNPKHYYFNTPDSMKNVISRLLNTLLVKAAVEEVRKSISKALGIVTAKEEAKEEKQQQAENSQESENNSQESRKPAEKPQAENPSSKTKQVKASEESAQTDDFFETESASEDDSQDSDDEENNLPELATGYISGGSDDEDMYNYDNDRVVKEATEKRKNRRGQRARQRLWEIKYGKDANHIKKQQQDKKHKQAARKHATSSNTSALGVRGSSKPFDKKDSQGKKPGLGKDKDEKPEHVHPSWEAKKKQNVSISSVKFTGKKITFD